MTYLIITATVSTSTNHTNIDLLLSIGKYITTTMNKKQDKSRKDVEAEIWSAITAFEQILEVLPNDRASLEALAHAYEQMGDHTKAKEYFVRLANVLLEEGDQETAATLIDKLKTYAEEDKTADALLKRINSLLQKKTSAPALTVSAESGQQKVIVEEKKAGAVFNISEELALAWTLLEVNQLTQDEYASVVQDLSEMSAKEAVSTVSVLHVLEARAFKNLEKIIAYISRKYGTPYISLLAFELRQEYVSVLPMDFVIRCGVLIFDFIGKDALAVIMNPANKQLRKEVESRAERKCHFYITLASEFDKAIEKIRSGNQA